MTVDLTCPFCSFSKKVPKEKIPAGVRWATCPRCQRRFEIPSLPEAASAVIGANLSRPQQPVAEEEAEKEAKSVHEEYMALYARSQQEKQGKWG